MARPLLEWDRGDLEALIIARVAESLTLDYKASAALKADDRGKAEIAKDVSSFANASGGRIIYGIAEADHAPTHVDDGVDAAVFSREWLENVITSNIAPRIGGLVIKPIDLGMGRCAYVVDIPAATAEGPHQASDHRYYKRFNFKSVPMEDYEVRDVMRRATTPVLKPRMAIVETTHNPYDGSADVELKLLVENLSSQPAMYTVMRIFADERCKLVCKPPWSQKSPMMLALGDALVGAHCAEQVRIAPRDLPVFKEELLYPGDVTVVVPLKIKDGIFGFSINTPGMTTIRYWVLKRDYGKISLEERFFEKPQFELAD
jgi:hypothetical protein